jgi:hypothetical protein
MPRAADQRADLSPVEARVGMLEINQAKQQEGFD